MLGGLFYIVVESTAFAAGVRRLWRVRLSSRRPGVGIPAGPPALWAACVGRGLAPAAQRGDNHGAAGGRRPPLQAWVRFFRPLLCLYHPVGVNCVRPPNASMITAFAAGASPRPTVWVRRLWRVFAAPLSGRGHRRGSARSLGRVCRVGASPCPTAFYALRQ